MFNKPGQNFFGVILALLIVVFIAVLFRYNGAKSTSIDKMTNYSVSPYPESQSGSHYDSSMNPVSASTLEGNNFLQVGSNSSSPESNGQKMNPHDLLPKDRNSEWASVNPASTLLSSNYKNGADELQQNEVTYDENGIMRTS